MHTDERGLPVTAANPDAVSLMDDTIRSFLEYRADTPDKLGRMLEADPDFVMGQCLKGYLMMMFGTVKTHDDARASLEIASRHAEKTTPREQAHVSALRAYLSGDIRHACLIWDDILAEHPRDIVALRLNHFKTFWMGRSAGLRDGIARVIDDWDDGVPGRGFVQGMYAFGLEEAGEYAAAEAMGKQAFEANKDDMWAIHAVAHVLEMQGRLDDGIEWLSRPADAWDDRNAMKGHLWWHLAMYYVEKGDYDQVLRLYDTAFRPEGSDFYLDIQNAASMLYRLEFQGVDIGDRWTELADVCETRVEDHTLAFTDLHVMLALARDGRDKAAGQLLESLRAYGNRADNYAAATMNPVTIPICEAIVAYNKQDYKAAFEQLLPIRHDLACVGGSHAQRDVFAQLLIVAAIKAGRDGQARALLAERVHSHPNSQGSWLLYADTLERTGQADRAAAARTNLH